MNSTDILAVRNYLLGLQDRICGALENEDGAQKFKEDAGERPEGGGGRTRVLADGAVFEQAGVNFSQVFGTALPPSATAHRPELAGGGGPGAGGAAVHHPPQPHVPAPPHNV